MAVIRGPHIRSRLTPSAQLARITHHGVLGHGLVVARLVEDGWIVVDVLDGHIEGAHIVQRRQAVIRGLHRDEDEFLVDGLVAVEDVRRHNDAGGRMDDKLGSIEG